MGYDRPYDGDIVFVRQEGLKDYTRHYLYSTWRSMNIRCYDDRHKSFHRYGGRGIEVCLEWRWDNPYGFVNFLNDMGDRPKGHTLDRMENDSSYAKDNCKWSTKKEQQNNLGVGINNNSGTLGVSYNKDKDGWIVQIQLNGTTHLLGTFNSDEKECAIERYEVVKQAKLTLGDDVAIDLYKSLKLTTPTGKQLRRNKKSKYFGVTPKRDKWRAYTNEYVDGKLRQISLGVFEDEELAYAAVLQRLENNKR